MVVSTTARIQKSGVLRNILITSCIPYHMLQVTYIQVVLQSYGIKICDSLHLLIQKSPTKKDMGTSINMYGTPNTELSGVTLQIQCYFS